MRTFEILKDGEPFGEAFEFSNGRVVAMWSAPLDENGNLSDEQSSFDDLQRWAALNGLDVRCVDESGETKPLVEPGERPIERIITLRDIALERLKKSSRHAERFERYRREYQQACTIEAIILYLEEQYSADVPVVRVEPKAGGAP